MSEKSVESSGQIRSLVTQLASIAMDRYSRFNAEDAAVASEEFDAAYNLTAGSIDRSSRFYPG